MSRPGLSVALLTLLSLMPSGPATGQPMMMDPSQMSGIPRQDPQVPPGTVTVRLIRGDLAHPLVDASVELVAAAEADKPPRAEKTGPEGRATFGTLPAAIYQARASIDGTTLTSQPIEVMPQPAPGVRVMLVFPKSLADQQQELGTPDGKARVDLKAEPGTLVVKAVDAAGQPLAGLQIVLGHIVRGGGQPEALPAQTTAADGTVHYSKLATGNEHGYAAVVRKDGGGQQSQSFNLATDHGSQLAITVQNVSRDASQLNFGQGSEILFQAQDDNVQVFELLFLINPLPTPVDPGPAGLRIPLAEDALSPQLAPGGPQAVSIDASQDGAPALVWRGPIPAGRTPMGVAFTLKQRGSLTFQQKVSVRFEGLVIGVYKLPDLRVEGVRDMEERSHDGKPILVGQAIVPSPGGQIELTLEGLPRDFYLLRIMAALFALIIGLVFAYFAIWGPASDEDEGEVQKQRQKLMGRREALLDELLRLEPGEGAVAPAPTTQKGKKRTATLVRGELEEIYRKLDESDGP